jgi:hypothetical protein
LKENPMSRSSDYYPPGVTGNESQITGEAPTVMADPASVGEEAPRWPDSHISHIEKDWEDGKSAGWAGPGWYFWDETQSQCYGPYKTLPEAKEKLAEYVKSLEPRWPEAKGYGLFILHCHCGWTTLKRTGDVAREIQPSPPQVCEACQSPSLSGASRREWLSGNHHNIAEMICTVTDKRSERVNEHARKHGLRLYQVSPKRWQWLKEAHGSSITYKDGQARAFVQLEPVTDPLDWQGAMKYLREKAPELPAYLAK